MTTIVLRLILIAVSLWAGGVAAKPATLLVTARWVFDGEQMLEQRGVLIKDGKLLAIGDPKSLRAKADKVLNLGDASLLPGFIELHGHLAFQQVPPSVILAHGVTTLRDVGGPLLAPSGGHGQLRLLTAGPILTVPGGYPLNVFAHHHAETGHAHQHLDANPLAIGLETADQARQVVRELIAGGAAVIKVALEPGGEPGAPWTSAVHSAEGRQWPIMSLELLQAITAEAHQQGKLVSAHLSEDQGVNLALQGGVDEWAHMPCLAISDELLKRAVEQHVSVVATLDTLSHCPGIVSNARRLSELGAEILYGAELAHPDIPWGIDSQELKLLMQLTGKTAIQALQAATAKAGKQLGLAPLGRLVANAPADLIAVKGDVLKQLKSLEYPQLVISGGRIIVNQF